MADQYEVVTEALRTQAAQWLELSDELATAESNAGRLTLDASAFFCGDVTSVALAPVYAGYQQFMTARLGEGKAEFAQLAGVLRKIADEYDVSDETSAQDLKDIYG